MVVLHGFSWCKLSKWSETFTLAFLLILIFPEMSSAEPATVVLITFLSGQSQHCLYPLSSAITHIRSMMKQFLKSVSVWQDTSHPQRASHDISVCIWSSVPGANPVGTWTSQAPNGPHHFPHDIQPTANMISIFCPLTAHMNIMFCFLRNGTM